MRIRSRWIGWVASGLIACTGSQNDGDVADVPAAIDVVTPDEASEAAAMDVPAMDATTDTIDVPPIDVTEDSPDEATDDAMDALDPLDVMPPSDDASTDGEVMLPPVCTGGEIPVATMDGESRLPSIVWTGTEYGVAWQDDEYGDWEILFARVAPDGTGLEELRVTEATGDDTTPSVAWDGTKFVVAWAHLSTDPTEGASIRTAAITRDAEAGGYRVGTMHTITDRVVDDAEQPALESIPASAGGGFAVAWEDSRQGADNHEIYFASLDANGTRRGANVRFTNAPRISYSPVMHWNARRGELGLLWLDDRDGTGSGPNEELYFARAMPNGTRPTGTMDARITNDLYRSLWPSFTYDATGVAISWANESDIPDRPHIFFTQRDDNGMPRSVGTAPVLAVSNNPPDIGAWTTAIGWNGAEYLVVWEDQRHRDGDLVVRRIGPSGTPLTGEVFLGQDEFFTGHPALVWNASQWAMVWEDDRYGHRDVFFRALARDACLTGE